MLRDEDESASAPPTVIVQSRDLSSAEAVQIYKAVVRNAAPAWRRDPIYWALALTRLVALIFAVAFFLRFTQEVNEYGFQYPGWGLVAVVCSAVLPIAAGLRMRHVIAMRARLNHAAGSRYVLTDEGLHVDMAGASFDFRWSCLRGISRSKSLAIIHVLSSQIIAVPKAACENQNVESFFAELERRWQAAKGAAHAG